MKNTRGIFILLVLAGVLGAFVWLKVDTVARLRGERAQLRADVADFTRLAELNARYKTAPAIDSAKLQRDANSVPVLNVRIEQMKETLARLSALPPPIPETAPDYTALWKNAGLSTPTNTLHSIIWASLNGDVDALGSMLFFDQESREAVETLWAGLSEAQRAQYPTGQKLMATLIAGRLTPALYQAEWREETREQPDVIKARFFLHRANPKGIDLKAVLLSFQRQGADWRLMVPKSVVAEFQQTLQSK
ncbi:MAG: hypothetical protein QM715_16175 [Nibricoccus sp.]